MQYSMGNLSFLASLWEWRTRWTCSLLENEASLCQFMVYDRPALPLHFSTLFPHFPIVSRPFAFPYFFVCLFLFICPFVLSGEALFAATTEVYLFVFLFIFKYHVSMNVWNKNLVTYIANSKISIKHFNLQFPELNDDIATFQNC